MKYTSTRDANVRVSFTEAITQGLSSDQGLYVPHELPTYSPSDWEHPLSLSQVAKFILPFWVEDPELRKNLDTICDRAFTFPTPLHLEEELAFLELYHGPTAAFKDVGARFLAECITNLPKQSGKDLSKRLVLVATSGDTGGAVAAAFYDKPEIEVVILYPEKGISERQELQLATWGKNIHALSVRGSFDDCQRLVKSALALPHVNKSLLSANSINIGRLLPQTFYYAMSSLEFVHRTSNRPGYIIPTGNLGNALAALWAKRMGFPIREVIFATNANRPVVDFLDSGTWIPHATLSTHANAMDVGNPSNMERLLHLYPKIEVLRKHTRAFSINNEQIEKSILYSFQKWGRAICPHTATAVAVWRELEDTQNWILVSTAHASKFNTLVEPIIGREIGIPPSLKEILSKKKVSTPIEADSSKLEKVIIKLLK